MVEPVRMVDLAAQHAEVRAELDAAVKQVVDAGAFVLGPHAERFETNFSQWLGVDHAIGVNSGTDALVLALDAVRYRRGPGKVVTTPFTFFATAEAILLAQHELVFADIEPATCNLDPAAANAAADGAVAIMPVHIFGQCADMDAYDASGLDLIEDAAQAVGATYKGRPAGGLGLAAGFSFYVTKNLGAAGDAGAITTNDAETAALLRSLRAHGEVRLADGRSYHYERVGRNSRLDGIQAAVLAVKLNKLDEWQAQREEHAAFYDQAFAELDGVTSPGRSEGSRHVFHQYVIRAERRDALRDHLTQHQIQTRVFYPEPLHLQPALSEFGFREGQFPVAEQACREVLSLPVQAHIGSTGRERVVDAVRSFYR
jgi:dTDP-4-amino-4,6-dideoxygalactose transaminase